MKIFLLISLAFAVVDSYAGLIDACHPKAELLQSACKKVEYANLPKEIQSLMKKQHCDVDTKSNYNFGSQLDLNDDGELEYIFCCSEASHGPCGARIYSKINKKWQSIEGQNGPLAFDSECSGISILAAKTEGFHDLCYGNLSSPLRKFGHGAYQSAQ